MGFFISRRTLGLIFLVAYAILLILGLTSPDEAHGWYYFVALIPIFIFYMILTRTNLIGLKVRKQNDGSLKPE